MRIRLLVCASLVMGVALGWVSGNQPVTVRAQAPKPPAVNPVRVPNNHFRGAKSSRHHWLAYRATNNIKFAHHPKPSAPLQFVPTSILAPTQMSMWGNDTYGDCVTAEEFFAKDIYPVWIGAGTTIDMPEALAVTWAQQNGYLNGANLTDVMDTMISTGVSYNGTTYTDGPYTAVDYTNWSNLTSAISQGPVKIGVASGQFDGVAGVGDQNGWVMSGFAPDSNEDHCVSLCGYGTMSYLAGAMGITLPAGVNGTVNGLLLYTWDSIGLIDFQSMTNITAEAWLRTPTTPQTPVPSPTPAPSPAPSPTPSPVPVVGGSYTITGTFTLTPVAVPSGQK